MKLATRYVEKPWGRFDIPLGFENPEGLRVGEIWFERPDGHDLPLLAKYIFTSENLSIQVHPNDVEARARGLDQGKNECWYILDAEPGARLGLGLRGAVSTAELRVAALTGSIEALLDWKPVAPNDFFFVPAGTIHAIGAGISLLEFQQYADATYRLYDYGRGRELHLEDGLAVAKLGPYSNEYYRRAGGDQTTVLMEGPSFSIVRASSNGAIPASFSNRQRWVMPLEGTVHSYRETASPGECLLIEPRAELSFGPSAVVLVGALEASNLASVT